MKEKSARVPEFLSMLGDVIWLHFLFVICCLPVITVGASATAAVYTGMKLAEGTSEGVTSVFFGAFRSNFRKATLIFLIRGLIGSGLLYALYYWVKTGGSMGSVMIIFDMIPLVLWVFSGLYVYGLQAKFENSPKNTLVNSLLVAVRAFPYTLLMLLIIAFIAVLFYIGPVTQAVLAFMGFGVMGLSFGYLYHRAFAPLLT